MPGNRAASLESSTVWLVRIALSRPYTFIVLALVILIISPIVILRTPTDIFPNINIPVIAVSWSYTGLNAEEMEGRITSGYERGLTTTVDNIEHIESTTINGQAIIKVFLQRAPAWIPRTRRSPPRRRPSCAACRPVPQPPLIINYSPSSVPILQLGLSGAGISEQRLNDLTVNFVRPQLVTVPGAVIPYPYGGKQRQIMINSNPRLLLSKGLSPSDVLNAVAAQSLVLPSARPRSARWNMTRA